MGEISIVTLFTRTEEEIKAVLQLNCNFHPNSIFLDEEEIFTQTDFGLRGENSPSKKKVAAALRTAQDWLKKTIAEQ